MATPALTAEDLGAYLLVTWDNGRVHVETTAPRGALPCSVLLLAVTANEQARLERDEDAA